MKVYFKQQCNHEKKPMGNITKTKKNEKREFSHFDTYRLRKTAVASYLFVNYFQLFCAVK